MSSSFSVTSRDVAVATTGVATGAVLFALWQRYRKSRVAPVTTPDGFRRFGTEVVDWISTYYEDLAADRIPVLSQVQPGYLAPLLPATAPESAEPFESIWADFQRHVMPGVTHWQSPMFDAYFPANSSFPGIIGEMLSAAINCIGFSWINSPACTELETVVMDWLARALRLPDSFMSASSGGGVIQGTASEACYVAVLAARNAKLNELGWTTSSSEYSSWVDRFVMYASDQSHSSIVKAARMLGLREANVRLLDTDPRTWTFTPVVFADAIAADCAAGLIPFFMCATVGTTSACAVDPIERIGPLCNEKKIWLHIDAAYAGSACICPEYRSLLNGVEYSDSFNFNAHKWLLVNFDCSCFWVKNRRALFDVLSITPAYMRNKWTLSGQVTDYRDWQIPLGRRFRAIKVWFVLRAYGLSGLRDHIRKCCQGAKHFADLVVKDDRFEMVRSRVLSLVCFRLKGSNELNQALVDAVTADGQCFIVQSSTHGRTFLRFVVGSPLTTNIHVDKAWAAIQRCAALILAADTASSALSVGHAH